MGAATHTDTIELSTFLMQLKNQRFETKSTSDYDVLKSKKESFLLNKNINVSKKDSEPKMENLTHIFEEWIDQR